MNKKQIIKVPFKIKLESQRFKSAVQILWGQYSSNTSFFCYLIQQQSFIVFRILSTVPTYII